jgi:hypothetical protein
MKESDMSGDNQRGQNYREGQFVDLARTMRNGPAYPGDQWGDKGANFGPGRNDSPTLASGASDGPRGYLRSGVTNDADPRVLRGLQSYAFEPTHPAVSASTRVPEPRRDMGPGILGRGPMRR